MNQREQRGFGTFYVANDVSPLNLLFKFHRAVGDFKDAITSHAERRQDSASMRQDEMLFQCFHTRPDALPSLCGPAPLAATTAQ